MRRPLLTLAILLVVFASLGFGWWSLMGPVQVEVTNHGATRLHVELRQVSESYSPRDERGQVLGPCGRLDLDPGATGRATFGRLADAELMLEVTDVEGVTRRFVIRQYLSHGKALALRIDLADGAVRAAQVRRGRFGPFEDVRRVDEVL